MEKVLEGSLTVKEASEFLSLSQRQVKRLKKGMKNKGVAALAHGNRGSTPKNTIPKNIRDRVAALVQDAYKGASCSHLAELFNEKEKICISAKSIARILREYKVIPPVQSKARRGHCTRDRAAQEGFLVQMDASPHHWLESRGPKLNLHGAIDDATGKVLGLHFCKEETMKGYFHVLHQMITNHGVPRFLYTDGHTIFFSPNGDRLSIEDELKGKQVALTQFGEAISQLAIQPIRARSPQAKGRIERLWETLQARLVVELRLGGVENEDAANAFLPGFMKRYNERFNVKADNPEPCYTVSPGEESLQSVLSAKEQRTASNGSVISYYGKTYRFLDKVGDVIFVPSGAKVQVLTHLDDSKDVFYQQKRYRMEECNIKKPEKKKPVPSGKGYTGHKPAPDHPWLKFTLEKPKADPVEAYFQKRERQHLSNLSDT